MDFEKLLDEAYVKWEEENHHTVSQIEMATDPQTKGAYRIFEEGFEACLKALGKIK